MKHTVVVSSIPTELIEAYKLTVFRVFSSPPFSLKIGQPSPELLDLYKDRDCNTAAYVTAWNPRSESKPIDENEAAQARLMTELEERSLDYISGIGQDPSHEWPGEPSFLVLGLSLVDAKYFGNRFGQNTLVWASSNAVPELLLLR